MDERYKQIILEIKLETPEDITGALIQIQEWFYSDEIIYAKALIDKLIAKRDELIIHAES